MRNGRQILAWLAHGLCDEVPYPIVDVLHKEIERALERDDLSPEVREAFECLAMNLDVERGVREVR
jgi:hypothetical protein